MRRIEFIHRNRKNIGIPFLQINSFRVVPNHLISKRNSETKLRLNGQLGLGCGVNKIALWLFLSLERALPRGTTREYINKYKCTFMVKLSNFIATQEVKFGGNELNFI